jgi:hypothetical protein
LGYLSLLKKIEVSKVDEETERQNQIANTQLTFNHIQDRINRLTDAYIDQLIDKGLFESRKESLYMEKKTLEEKLCELKSDKESVCKKMKKFLELAKSISLNYENGILEEKRDILQKTTSNRLVAGKNVDISLKSPYLELREYQNIDYSPPYRGRPRTFESFGVESCLGRQVFVNKVYNFLKRFFSKENMQKSSDIQGKTNFMDL